MTTGQSHGGSAPPGQRPIRRSSRPPSGLGGAGSAGGDAGPCPGFGRSPTSSGDPLAAPGAATRLRRTGSSRSRATRPRRQLLEPRPRDRPGPRAVAADVGRGGSGAIALGPGRDGGAPGRPGPRRRPQDTAPARPGRLVISAGAWAATLEPSLADLAIPERQVLGWQHRLGVLEAERLRRGDVDSRGRPAPRRQNRRRDPARPGRNRLWRRSLMVYSGSGLRSLLSSTASASASGTNASIARPAERGRASAQREELGGKGLPMAARLRIRAARRRPRSSKCTDPPGCRQPGS